MKTSKIQSSPRSHLIVRLILLVTCAVVIALELIFSYFHVSNRPIPGFDNMAALCIPIIVYAIIIFFPGQWHLDFESTQLGYKICVFIAGFVLLIKITFFAFYFVAMLLDHLF